MVWYQSKKHNLWKLYRQDAVFCNEKQISGTVNNNGDGLNLVPATYYSAHSRLTATNKTATLSCSSVVNRFSKTTNKKGNGKLLSPLALVTADEVALAGGKLETENKDYYLRTNAYFCTMSPSHFNAGNANAYVLCVKQTGLMDSSTYGLRAVINLKSNVLLSEGDGTIDNPYQIQMS